MQTTANSLGGVAAKPVKIGEIGMASDDLRGVDHTFDRLNDRLNDLCRRLGCRAPSQEGGGCKPEDTVQPESSDLQDLRDVIGRLRDQAELLTRRVDDLETL